MPEGLTDSAKSVYDVGVPDRHDADANDDRRSGQMAFDEKDQPDGHDADVCSPADHQNLVFLDTGLPSHPLMDDEGSQSKLDTPKF